MSNNVYRRLLDLMPESPVNIGQVISVNADGCTIQLRTGERASVRGVAAVGAWVYVRDGVIEGPAPELDTVEIEV